MECTIPQILTPLAALGRKAKTARQIAKELAQKTDLNPLAMINLISASGGVLAVPSALRLLTDQILTLV